MATVDEFMNFMPAGALTCDRCANPTKNPSTYQICDLAFGVGGAKLRLCNRCREEFRDWWMDAKPRREEPSNG